MYGTANTPQPLEKGKTGHGKVKVLLWELESHDEDENLFAHSTPSSSSSDPAKPWLKEFHYYLNSFDEIPEGMSIVQWWGVSCIIILICIN
jgi:hypothetical protein